MADIGETQLYFLRQMNDPSRKKLLSASSNHPTERGFDEGEKSFIVLSLIKYGYLTGRIGKGHRGAPDYSEIAVSTKGKLRLEMEDF